MSLHPIPAADALARLHEFSAVIDARSESEYALDRCTAGAAGSAAARWRWCWDRSAFART